MKKNLSTLLFILLIVGLSTINVKAQTSPGAMPSLAPANPWTNRQLLAPGKLAAELSSGDAKTPLIFNIGAVEDIKNAKHIGAVNNAENLEKLKKAVARLPKNTAIVIYCGCCPFSKCPNIRPAFVELKKLGFTNVKLLDLPVNLKTNWIAEKYPLASK